MAYNGHDYSSYYRPQAHPSPASQPPQQAHHGPSTGNTDFPYYDQQTAQNTYWPSGCAVLTDQEPTDQQTSHQRSYGPYANTYSNSLYAPGRSATQSAPSSATRPCYGEMSNHGIHFQVDTTALGKPAYTSELGRNGLVTDPKTQPVASSVSASSGFLSSPMSYPPRSSDSRGPSISIYQSTQQASYSARLAASALAQAQQTLNTSSNESVQQNHARPDHQRPYASPQTAPTNAPQQSTMFHGSQRDETLAQNRSSAAQQRAILSPWLKNGTSGIVPQLHQTPSLNDTPHGSKLGHEQCPPQPMVNTYVRPYSDRRETPRMNLKQPLTAVDPSQVLDQAEYQRQKAATEAEGTRPDSQNPTQRAQPAKTVPAEALINGQASDAGRSLVTPEMPVKLSNANGTSKELLAAEMKAMIEKMREFKAKDPSMFSEVWEHFKKVQPPNARASSQASQAGKCLQDANTLPTQVAKLVSPTLNSRELSLPAETVETDGVGHVNRLPDLGKFPAQRRKTGRDTGVSRSPCGSMKKRMQVIDLTRSDSPAPIVSSESNLDPKAWSISTPVLPVSQKTDQVTGEDKTRQAMHSYHLTGHDEAVLNGPSMPAGRLTDTVWPDERRHVLAAVAKATLEAYSANVGKKIATEDIIALLSRNPSYEQLCQFFQARGFALERSEFARVLLTAVPDTPRVPPSANTSHPLVPPSCDTMDRQGDALEQQFASPPRHGYQAKVQSIRFQGPSVAPLPGSTTRQDGFTSPQVSKNQHPPLPLPFQYSFTSPVVSELQTKEQMARKRTFEDIVDLTAEDEDEEKALERYKRQELLASTNKPLRLQKSFGPDPDPHGALRADRIILTGASRFDHFRAAGSHVSGREALRSDVVVKELNPADARRRSKYDARTIARDFLISRGEHPTEPPLNWHLDKLRTNFRHVTLKSDLSTFRWDLVDPGSPAEAEKEEKERLHADSTVNATSQNAASQKPQDSVEGEEDMQSVTNAQNGPSSLDKPVTVTTSRPSIMTRGRPSGRGRGRRSLAGRPPGFGHVTNGEGLVSNQETIDNHRISARSPSPSSSSPPSPSPLPSSVHPVVLVASSNPKVSGALISSSSKAELNTPRVAATPQPATPATSAIDLSMQGTTVPQPSFTLNSSLKSVPLSFTPGNLAVVIPSRSNAPTTEKRRGRPPGSKNRNLAASSDHAPGGSQSGTPVLGLTPNPRGISKKRGRPPGSKRSTPSRGRGRPLKRYVDPRPTTIPADGIAVFIPDPLLHRTPLSFIEPRPLAVRYGGNEHRTGRGGPEIYPDTDSYQVFPCRWRGCTAELHNLATLRKHVERIHGQIFAVAPDVPIMCLWGKCCVDEGTRFETLQSWEQHLETFHYQPVARTLGDGPSVEPLDIHPIRYLAGPDGKLATPLARVSGLRDPLPVGAGKKPTREYHKAHGNVTQSQKDRAMEMSARARAVDLKMQEEQGLLSPVKLASGVQVEIPLTNILAELEFTRDESDAARILVAESSLGERAVDSGDGSEDSSED